MRELWPHCHGRHGEEWATCSPELYPPHIKVQTEPCLGCGQASRSKAYGVPVGTAQTPDLEASVITFFSWLPSCAALPCAQQCLFQEQVTGCSHIQGWPWDLLEVTWGFPPIKK